VFFFRFMPFLPQFFVTFLADLPFSSAPFEFSPACSLPPVYLFSSFFYAGFFLFLPDLPAGAPKPIPSGAIVKNPPPGFAEDGFPPSLSPPFQILSYVSPLPPLTNPPLTDLLDLDPPLRFFPTGISYLPPFPVSRDFR